LLAGDGYIVKIREPRGVDNPVTYRNRKNCFALRQTFRCHKIIQLCLRICGEIRC
jgi:hypothetical protein